MEQNNIISSLNRIELIGTVGAVRRTALPDGKSVTRFTLATNFAFRDSAGCPVIETTWHSCTALPGGTPACALELEKGSKVRVTGRVHNQRYAGSDGIERTSAEVVVKSLEIIRQEVPLGYEMYENA